MKIFKFGIRLWITITSILTFIVGWVMLAHAPKPSQPGSSTQAIAPPLPTLEPLPSLFQENGKSVQNNELQNHAMNTTVLLAAEGERAIDGMQATKIFIDECEQRFSRFLPASEITELNRFSGEWLKVSGDLMEMLELAQKYFEETQGIFDPSILPDLKHAGYDRSMDIIRANGVENDLPAPKQISRPAFSRMSLDPDGNQVRLLHGMEIDLGGIAKGCIVKQAARLLHRYSEVCGVSAGGDILFLGQPEDGLGWDVYLEDPRDPAQMLAQLNIPSGAVATSSVTKRSWQQV
jgi:thiamine biosynthesis lipoprotein